MSCSENSKAKPQKVMMAIGSLGNIVPDRGKSKHEIPSWPMSSIPEEWQNWASEEKKQVEILKGERKGGQISMPMRLSAPSGQAAKQKSDAISLECLKYAHDGWVIIHYWGIP